VAPPERMDRRADRAEFPAGAPFGPGARPRGGRGRIRSELQCLTIVCFSTSDVVHFAQGRSQGQPDFRCLRSPARRCSNAHWPGGHAPPAVREPASSTTGQWRRLHRATANLLCACPSTIRSFCNLIVEPGVHYKRSARGARKSLAHLSPRRVNGREFRGPAAPHPTPRCRARNQL